MPLQLHSHSDQSDHHEIHYFSRYPQCSHLIETHNTIHFWQNNIIHHYDHHNHDVLCFINDHDEATNPLNNL